MTIRPNTLPVSRHEGVYCKDSVDQDGPTGKIQWRSEKIDDHCEKNDNYSVINTLFDDKLLGLI